MPQAKLKDSLLESSNKDIVAKHTPEQTIAKKSKEIAKTLDKKFEYSSNSLAQKLIDSEENSTITEFIMQDLRLPPTFSRIKTFSKKNDQFIMNPHELSSIDSENSKAQFLEFVKEIEGSLHNLSTSKYQEYQYIWIELMHIFIELKDFIDQSDPAYRMIYAKIVSKISSVPVRRY